MPEASRRGTTAGDVGVHQRGGPGPELPQAVGERLQRLHLGQAKPKQSWNSCSMRRARPPAGCRCVGLGEEVVSSGPKQDSPWRPALLWHRLRPHGLQAKEAAHPVDERRGLGGQVGVVAGRRVGGVEPGAARHDQAADRVDRVGLAEDHVAQARRRRSRAPRCRARRRPWRSADRRSAATSRRRSRRRCVPRHLAASRLERTTTSPAMDDEQRVGRCRPGGRSPRRRRTAAPVARRQPGARGVVERREAGRRRRAGRRATASAGSADGVPRRACTRPGSGTGSRCRARAKL